MNELTDPEWLAQPTSNPDVTKGDILKALLLLMGRMKAPKQEAE
jgi:hypothetical protein